MKPLLALLSASIVTVACMSGCSSDPQPAATARDEGGSRCHSGGSEGSTGGGSGLAGKCPGRGCCRARAGEDSTPAATPAPEEILVALPEGLARPGDQRIVSLSSGHNVLVWRTDDSYGAASASCTHMGGTLRYNLQELRLECPNHGSRFNLDGSIINGPAEKPLLVYKASLAEGKLHLAPQPIKE